MPSGGRLEGKASIVTGVGPGIGSAISVRFALEGASVVMADIDPAAALRAERRISDAGGTAVVVNADVSAAADWARLVTVALDKFGKVDILVNSASSARMGKITDISEHDWNYTLAHSLSSVFLGCRACIPLMISAGGGSIVNISSANGIFANPGMAAYVAAKTGLLGLTRSVALDYGLQGVRCNAICPGLVVNEATVGRYERDSEEERGAGDPYMVGRWGSPSDVANAAVYLASDEAAFVTAAVLSVDGGLTAQSPEATIRPSFRRRWRDDVAVIREVRHV